jgi:DNA-binding NarL/FixJ family response regulator
MNKAIRILLVDDHATILIGLKAILQSEPDMEVVGSASTGAEALQLFHQRQPDLTILDMGLKAAMTGIETIQAIRLASRGARIVAISALRGDDLIFRALQAGAATYLLKDELGDNLVPIIREVHAGGCPVPPATKEILADRVLRGHLTQRETEVLRLIADGLSNKEIGARLRVTEQTAEFHVRNILSKLGVNDRTKAATTGIRRGIIEIPEN